MIYLSIILLVLSGVFNGFSDRSNFHPSSLPPYLQNRNWWNTGKIPSWGLKYKNGKKEDGERFFLSTTLFVGITDAHHFFKAIGQVLFSFALGLMYYYYNWIYPEYITYFLWGIGLTIYKVGFHLSYR